MNRRQIQGFAGMAIMALLLVVAVTSIFVVTVRSSERNSLERIERSRVALAAAREALLSFAAANQNRGYLPCPANPALAGTSAAGTMLSTCTTPSSRIGRLPWRSLGVDELRDGTGEPLWYAVSASFTNDAATVNATASVGNLTLNAMTGNAALVLASGEALPSQIRSPAIALCSTTTTNIRRDYCAANYLDTDPVSTVSNADADADFVAVNSSGFNDLVLTVSDKTFFARVGQRVLQDVKACLLRYASQPGNANGTFPWAHRADSSEPDPADKGEEHEDHNGTSIGRIADVLDDSPFGWTAQCPMPSCPSPGICTVTKNWLMDWRELVFYVVADDFSPDGPGTAGGVGNLTVGGTTGIRAAVLVAGPPLSAQTRLSVSTRQNRANYLEGNQLSTFGTPPQTWDVAPQSSTFNDRVLIVSP